MYLLIIPFIVFKNINRNIFLAIIFLLFLFSVYASIFDQNLLENIIRKFSLNAKHFYRLLSYFLAGIILSLVNIDKIKTNLNISILVTVLLLSIYIGLYEFISPFILPLITILIGLSFNKYSWMFTEKLGDISYGVYIYGFVVQQTLMNYFSLNPYQLMIFALSITYIFAYISWHLIEKRALEYKNYLY